VANWFKRFLAQPLSLTLAEIPWAGFLLSTVLLAAMVNLATGVVGELVGPIGTLVFLLLITVITVVVLNLYARRVQQRVEAGERVIGGKSAPQQRSGIIVLFSNMATARTAVEYHQGRLAHVWVVVTPEMREGATELCSYVEGNLSAKAHMLEIQDEFDLSGCYDRVQEVYRALAPDFGLSANDVIADLTGGTKLMTAGLVVACSDLNQPLQYVPTQRKGGEPIGPFRPIEVALARSGRAR
jgi:hypothetical protein